MHSCYIVAKNLSFYFSICINDMQNFKDVKKGRFIIHREKSLFHT